jgi:hypothetical protein
MGGSLLGASGGFERRDDAQNAAILRFEEERIDTNSGHKSI